MLRSPLEEQARELVGLLIGTSPGNAWGKGVSVIQDRAERVDESVGRTHRYFGVGCRLEAAPPGIGQPVWALLVVEHWSVGAAVSEEVEYRGACVLSHAAFLGERTQAAVELATGQKVAAAAASAAALAGGGTAVDQFARHEPPRPAPAAQTVEAEPVEDEARVDPAPEPPPVAEQPAATEPAPAPTPAPAPAPAPQPPPPPPAPENEFDPAAAPAPPQPPRPRPRPRKLSAPPPAAAQRTVEEARAANSAPEKRPHDG